MFAALANPHRFMAVSRWATPICGVVAVLLIAPGLDAAVFYWAFLASIGVLTYVILYLL